MRGNHTETPQNSIEPKKRNLTVPITPPLSLINRFSLKPFNSSYFNLKKRQVGQKIVHYSSFFYPLDNLLQWSRLYGPKGFYQYQCVVPFANGKAIIQAILNTIAVSGEGSFLAVLKTFGARQPLGMLSFPQPGITLALDFPNKSQSTLTLFERLDAIVHEVGGRIYLAKDMRMSPECFEAGYPKLPAFLPFRDRGISSAMSRRLMGY
ncbi:FAD linked oxidase [Candidatus Regiella insecticola 5.15]|uniref:FAD linked oxidase n=1 Tax=Candidatus Regiella insecticola 5.15 TaxID=1005043 RepID=G2GYE3_9ENTR|nr:hypothetical protein [Candidatus Regiella insecticola]EGY29236.1 FAD linked oxidase [Candidatus Regiella insecticola 5.15]